MRWKGDRASSLTSCPPSAEPAPAAAAAATTGGGGGLDSATSGGPTLPIDSRFPRLPGSHGSSRVPIK
uniref:Uncharacterized protein n=1 Tax=Triticum urartu TaxID=4572 RepID=A0A8R7QU54_TRIUA